MFVAVIQLGGKCIATEAVNKLFIKEKTGKRGGKEDGNAWELMGFVGCCFRF